MTHLAFLFCYLLSLYFWSHLEAVLSTFKILSCTDNKKYGKASYISLWTPTESGPPVTLRTGGDLNFAASFDCCLKDNHTDITITLETKLNILKSNTKKDLDFYNPPIGHLHDDDLLLLRPESFRVLLSCAN